MKKLITNTLILTFAVLFSMGGCLKKLTVLNFDVDVDGEVSTTELTTTGNQTFGEQVMINDIKKELEENGTSTDLLDEMKLKSAMITITMPQGANFDAIDNISLSISTPTRPEVLMASKMTVAKGTNTITLDVNTSEDLKPYLLDNSFTYKITGSNNAPVAPMTLEMATKWTVKASAK